jgi:hypothetical protein
VSTPAGAGILPIGIFHRTGVPPAVAARLTAATTVAAMAHNIVRRSMYSMRLLSLSSRSVERFLSLCALSFRRRATGEPVRELAKAFGIARATAYRYLAHDDPASWGCWRGRLFAGFRQGQHHDKLDSCSVVTGVRRRWRWRSMTARLARCRKGRRRARDGAQSNQRHMSPSSLPPGDDGRVPTDLRP